MRTSKTPLCPWGDGFYINSNVVPFLIDICRSWVKFHSCTQPANRPPALFPPLKALSLVPGVRIPLGQGFALSPTFPLGQWFYTPVAFGWTASKIHKTGFLAEIFLVSGSKHSTVILWASSKLGVSRGIICLGINTRAQVTQPPDSTWHKDREFLPADAAQGGQSSRNQNN